MDAQSVAVALVPREVFSTTQRSVETLFARPTGLSGPGSLKVVAVDGASPPGVRDYLEQASAAHGFTLLRSDRYLTPNEGRNLAANEAFRDPAVRHVVFVDNDVLVSPGWLGALVRCADETGAWVVGPAYYEHLPEEACLHMVGGECRIEQHADGRREYVEIHRHAHKRADEVTEPLVRHETKLIEFHTALVSREAWERLGGLDDLLPCGGEHGDFCLTVQEAGGSIWIEPEAKITYAPPKRLAREDRAFFFLRWSEARLRANRERFAAKWGLGTTRYDRGRAIKWLTQHRRYGYESLARLERWVGRRWRNRFERKVFAPIERIVNRLQYPYAKYGHRTPPAVEVVHRRPTLADAA
ncbi:MAG: glycosyltransferase [Planctomycetota bacterium]